VNLIDVPDVLAAVQAFDPAGNRRATQSRERILALLRAHPHPFARTSYDPGHITASGVVLSTDRTALLLVFHRRLGRWLQPGGHLEPDDDEVAAAARREIIEETKIVPDPAVPPLLVGVDVHEIPPAQGEPAHCHHDLVYRFAAPRHAPSPSSEVSQAVWYPIDRLGDAGADEPLLRAVARARELPLLPRPD
jgi:8-oxo-dGTP pyrophosphatase MutT (NUDIX family)